MSCQTWIVWHPAGGEEGPDDGTAYRAESAQGAAELWGQHFDREEPSLEDEPELVKVFSPVSASGEFGVQTFHVRASIRTEFHADEVIDL